MIGAALIACAYLLGSVCFGPIVARRREVDLREVGSGNVGATNVGRALGRRMGLLVLVLDLTKGVVPMVVARRLAVPPEVWVATGVAAVLGHVFPIWFRFRGGKGAATAAGVMLGAMPIPGALALSSFALLKLATRRASVGSIGGAAIGLASTYALHGLGPELILAAALFFIVLVRHVENLRRIVRGEEPPG
jgi:glycerol-3-phosphate acyltransferase PlsY